MGTLHTGSIRGSTERLRDIGVDSHELKHILRGVLTQRLMRVLCLRCYGENPHCSDCSGGGYSGRTIISECHYFESDDEVKRLLTTDDIFWDTMVDDAYSKYKKGETSFEELFRIFGADATKIVSKGGFNEFDKRLISEGKLKVEGIH
jgi:general secretion pathway protein E